MKEKTALVVKEVAPICDGLSSAESKKLERCAIAIDKAKAKTIEAIFEIGQQLSTAHEQLANHGDGTFGKWCAERCGISRTAAFEAMRVVEVFGKHKSLVCSPGEQSFDAKAIYYLSRDTTPEEAINDALKYAKQGERITIAKAKEIVAGYTVDESEDVDADAEIAAEADYSDESETEWDSVMCDWSLSNEANKWWRACPEAERQFIPQTLHALAKQLEKRLNDQAT